MGLLMSAWILIGHNGILDLIEMIFMIMIYGLHFLWIYIHTVCIRFAL